MWRAFKFLSSGSTNRGPDNNLNAVTKGKYECVCLVFRAITKCYSIKRHDV